MSGKSSADRARHPSRAASCQACAPRLDDQHRVGCGHGWRHRTSRHWAPWKEPDTANSAE